MKQAIRFTLFAATILSLPRMAVADEKKCVFSIEVVTDGGGLRRPGDTSVGDGVFIYELPTGDLVAERHEGWHGSGPREPANNESWGAGKEFTSRLREAFKEAHLRDSDFLGSPLIGRQDLKTGVPFVFNAQIVRVHADLEGTSFTLVCATLGPRLDFYARSDPTLSKLKTLLDRIASDYGRTKLWLN